MLVIGVLVISLISRRVLERTDMATDRDRRRPRGAHRRTRERVRAAARLRRAAGLGALVFLFPFYYMLVGRCRPSRTRRVARRLPEPGNLTLDNYVADQRARSTSAGRC